MSPDTVFEKCAQMNIALDTILVKARNRAIPDDTIMAAIEGAPDRVELIRALKQTGLSLVDIGQCVGVSRETVRKIVGPGAPAAVVPRPKPTRTVDEVRDEIWREAIIDPSWWRNDTLNKDKIIERLKDNNYLMRHIRSGLLNSIWRPKTEIILTTVFEIPVEQHRDWINRLLEEGNTFTDILEMVNSKIEFGLSFATLLRYCRQINANRRRTGPYSRSKQAAIIKVL
jgi:hypothetical protein